MECVWPLVLEFLGDLGGPAWPELGGDADGFAMALADVGVFTQSASLSLRAACLSDAALEYVLARCKVPLQTVRLTGCVSLTERGAAALAAHLGSVVEQQRHLSRCLDELALPDSWPGAALEVLVAPVAARGGVRRLSLDRAPLADVAVAHLENSSNGYNLSCWDKYLGDGCGCVTDATALALVGAWGWQVQHLNLGGWRCLSDACVAEIVRCCPKLESISVDRTGVSVMGARALKRCPLLRSVSAEGTKFGSQAMRGLCLSARSAAA